MATLKEVEVTLPTIAELFANLKGHEKRALLLHISEMERSYAEAKDVHPEEHAARMQVHDALKHAANNAGIRWENLW